ncbi:MAG: peptide ABC transporter substrate-binding protein [Anaerolineae bacterium]
MSNTRMRIPAFALFFFLLLALLAGCATSSVPKITGVKPQATPTVRTTGRGVGDTLYIVNTDTPTTLNPHLTSSVKDWEPSRITLEPLASFDKNGILVPFLAAEIPSKDNGELAADGKSVTWKLKQNVKWSDGQPFTADDVLFTYQFATNAKVKAKTASIYKVIKSIDVVDPYTVKLNFTDVNPAWALPFVGVQGAILPKHIYDAYNNENAAKAPANTLPIGTGPYRAVAPGIKPQEVLFLGAQILQTNKIVFEPNPYFREADKPYFSKIEMRGGGTVDEAARLVFEDGSVDYAYNMGKLAPTDLANLAKSTTGQLVTNFGAKVDRIMLNRTDPRQATSDGERSSLKFPHPFFADPLVRQAFAYAINREAMAALYGPVGKPTTNDLVAPPQYASPNAFYNFDLKKAADLLDQAGWKDVNNTGVREKNGVKMKVTYVTPSTHFPQIRQIVQDALKSIGVDVELKIVDSGILFADCGASNPDGDTCFNADMQEFAIRSVNPDPSAYMQNWTCAQIPQKANNWVGGNDERWCSPDYENLFQQSQTELDPAKRAQLIIQMNDMLTKDVVMIPVVYLADAQGVSRTIQGVDLTPWDMNTWNIKDWRRVTP